LFRALLGGKTTRENRPNEQMVLRCGTALSSYGDVVDFCLSSGVPVSRMLRLDLMRLRRYGTTANRNGDGDNDDNNNNNNNHER